MAIGTPAVILDQLFGSAAASHTSAGLAGSVAAGSLVIVNVNTFSTQTVTSVTDSAGTTYTKDKEASRLANDVAVFSGYSAGGLSAGVTFTANYSGSTSATIKAFSVSGIASSSCVNGTPSSGQGFSGLLDSGGIVTSVADVLLFGANLATAGDISAAGSFTELSTSAGGSNLQCQSRIVAATGTYNSTARAQPLDHRRGDVTAAAR
jgi:hypothetical protein